MNPSDVSKQLHERLKETSDDIFKLLMEKNVPEKVAFLALCMTLSRLAVALEKDPEVIHNFVTVYFKACQRIQERKYAEKKGLLN